MDQEKKITAPRSLWDRLRAMMQRDGFPTINEAVRFSIRAACEMSEHRAANQQINIAKGEGND